MITLKEYKKDFFKALENHFPSTEIDTFFMYLIEEYLDFKRIDIVLNPDFLINEEKISFFDTALIKLKNHEPIQYILGKTEFFGFPFIVDKNCIVLMDEVHNCSNEVTQSLLSILAPNKEKKTKYVPIEEWDSQLKDSMTAEERLQWECQRGGNRIRQNDILQHHLKSF